MNSSWKVNKFADAPVAIIDGDRGKNYPKQDEFSEEGYCLFLNANNVTSEGFLFQSAQFITKEKDGVLRSGKLNRNDVVMTTRGTIGNVAYFNKKVPFEHLRINSGMVIFRCDREKILPAFLFQYLRSSGLKSQINALKSGVAQPQLPICDIKQMTIPLPSISEQGKISGFLSAYDNLIDNNNCRIKILEEMVQTIYSEWFVKFRFPGYSKSKMVNSELGKIPEGWLCQNLNDTFSIKYGKNLPTSKINKDDKYPVYGAGGIIGYYNQCLYEDKVALVTCRGNGSGDVSRTKEAAFVTNNSLIVLPVETYSHWKYFFIELFLRALEVRRVRSGSAQPQITIDGLSTLKAIIPTGNAVTTFCSLTEPLIEQVDLLCRKNSILQKSRDILLPKLISGEIDVDNLDINTEDIE